MSDKKNEVKPEVVATVTIKKVMGIPVPVVHKVKEGPGKLCGTIATMLVGKAAAKAGGFYHEKPAKDTTKPEIQQANIPTIVDVNKLSAAEKLDLLKQLEKTTTGGG